MSLDPITIALIALTIATGPAGWGTLLVGTGVRVVGTAIARTVATQVVKSVATGAARGTLTRLAGSGVAKELEGVAARALGKQVTATTSQAAAVGQGAARAGTSARAGTAASGRHAKKNMENMLALLPAPYRIPLRGSTHVLRGFDKPAQNWLPGHRGVDLAANAGAPVLAASNGKIFYAGKVATKSTVSIMHARGIRTTYEPVIPTVKTGDVVKAGQVIGRIAPFAAHCAPKSCLHWGAIKNAEYIDPLTLIGEVRLLPLR
ncbi:Membrane-bound metallopeptidase [Dermatophilus congolensis]|uniref:Membrane-bound metallopeptidase n=1 Tax=Dermatophilus congolensis TaxID=1863 RepID=A0A239VGH0_9MICO|nr:M23 family metallopeptidase [Dermatophilus congolensis]SNV20748.1 Membrane-bound metallopeptidase [Dermatophilus congolensis]